MIYIILNSRLPRSSAHSHLARARIHPRTHARTHDHARCTPSCRRVPRITENASRNIYRALLIRLSALDCRSRGRQTQTEASGSESPGLRFPPDVTPPTSLSSLFLRRGSRSHFLPSSLGAPVPLSPSPNPHRISLLPLRVLPFASLMYIFFSSLTCRLPVASLRAHSHR